MSSSLARAFVAGPSRQEDTARTRDRPGGETAQSHDDAGACPGASRALPLERSQRCLSIDIASPLPPSVVIDWLLLRLLTTGRSSLAATLASP
jgi:hypothetical protein